MLVARIGNQFHIALYDCLLQDKSDVILYQILSQDIIPAILNKGGDLIGVQSNPLDNTYVKDYHYSPEALFNEVAKVFYDPTKKKPIGRNAADLIKDKYGVEKTHEIIDLLAESKFFNQDAAQIAAYCTLSHSELMPKERLQSILGSNISLNDENKTKLTNILEVPNGVADEITVDEITIEFPSSAVSENIPESPNRGVSEDMPEVPSSVFNEITTESPSSAVDVNMPERPNNGVKATIIQRLMACLTPFLFDIIFNLLYRINMTLF